MSVHLIGYIIAESPRAFLFQDHYWDEPDWMPKRQCETLRDPDTFEVQLKASDWIADQKGLEEPNHDAY